MTNKIKDNSNLSLENIKKMSNHVLITKSFIDILEIEEMLNTNKVPNFGLLFDNMSIEEIIKHSKLISKFIIFHQKYEFSHFDLNFLKLNYRNEQIKLFIYELYNNSFINEFRELLMGLKEILRFYRRIETKKSRFNKELRNCILEICYCIHSIKHFFDKPSWNYLNTREICLRDFYAKFQKLMSKSHWRIAFINLSSQKIINVSDHLQISKTKREQNFILWTTLGAIIGFFVKEILVHILHLLHVPFF